MKGFEVWHHVFGCKETEREGAKERASFSVLVLPLFCWYVTSPREEICLIATRQEDMGGGPPWSGCWLADWELLCWHDNHPEFTRKKEHASKGGCVGGGRRVEPRKRDAEREKADLNIFHLKEWSPLSHLSFLFIWLILCIWSYDSVCLPFILMQ